jgi:hypothetical protein
MIAPERAGERVSPALPAWNGVDEGWLHARQWADSLAAGAPLPRLAVSVRLNPGEVAHATIAPVAVEAFFGEQSQYRRSFLLVGGPVGLALTGAASLAHNASKRAEAERAAAPRWHQLGAAQLTVTNQRLVLRLNQHTESLWHAEAGGLQLAGGEPSTVRIQLQPAGLPLLRLGSPSMPVIYVFVHHLRDGRPPALPVPAGLFERARAAGLA